MDDMTDKISELLQNPQGIEKIRSLAQTLINDNEKEQPTVSSPSLPDFDFGKLLNVVNRLQNSRTDERAKLLIALRPHLSANRQSKVDKAVKILKLIDLLPIIQESGIINF